MASSLNDFLNWFAGYAENIDKAPTAKQWARIVAKVKDLQAAHASGEVERIERSVSAPAQTAAPAVRDAKPTTQSAWKAQFQAALIEGGCDDETARDFAGDVAVDMSKSPRDAAAETLSSLGIPTQH